MEPPSLSVITLPRDKHPLSQRQTRILYSSWRHLPLVGCLTVNSNPIMSSIEFQSQNENTEQSLILGYDQELIESFPN